MADNVLRRPPTPQEIARQGNPPATGAVTPRNNAGVGPGAPPQRTGFSKVRHTGLNQASNNSVTTTPAPISPNNYRSPVVYVWADRGNSDFILIGDEGTQVADLNAGDVVPFFDVAPNDLWVKSNSGTQKVHFLGHGDPDSGSPIVLPGSGVLGR